MRNRAETYHSANCFGGTVSLADVKGSGRDGRVLKEDVVQYLEAVKEVKNRFVNGVGATMQPGSVTATSAIPVAVTADRQLKASDIVKLPVDVVEPIKGVKKAMVKSMTAALAIPHFGYCDEVNFSQLVGLRKEMKESAKLRGINLSYMPILIKAVSLALTQFPSLNAHVDEKCEVYTYKGAHNIGVAIDTKNGLVVPNIKNVQLKSCLDVAADLSALQERASRNQLQADDLREVTFTLSNIGSIGGTYAKPVILPPTVAIGALGKLQVLPRFGPNDEIIKCHIMQVSWAADHRVIDGATMARFSNLWKSYIENPSLMLLDMR